MQFMCFILNNYRRNTVVLIPCAFAAASLDLERIECHESPFVFVHMGSRLSWKPVIKPLVFLKHVPHMFLRFTYIVIILWRRGIFHAPWFACMLDRWYLPGQRGHWICANTGLNWCWDNPGTQLQKALTKTPPVMSLYMYQMRQLSRHHARMH